jgi:hypothetical protein
MNNESTLYCHLAITIYLSNACYGSCIEGDSGMVVLRGGQLDADKHTTQHGVCMSVLTVLTFDRLLNRRNSNDRLVNEIRSLCYIGSFLSNDTINSCFSIYHVPISIITLCIKSNFPGILSLIKFIENLKKYMENYTISFIIVTRLVW